MEKHNQKDATLLQFISMKTYNISFNCNTFIDILYRECNLFHSHLPKN